MLRVKKVLEFYNNKFYVKKEDMVMVISGKDKGKKGCVIVVYFCENCVFVEGVNMIKKY